MGLFGKSREQKITEFKEKQSMLNGKELKKLLTLFKENRDEIEKAHWQETRYRRYDKTVHAKNSKCLVI